MKPIEKSSNLEKEIFNSAYKNMNPLKEVQKDSISQKENHKCIKNKIKQFKNNKLNEPGAIILGEKIGIYDPSLLRQYLAKNCKKTMPNESLLELEKVLELEEGELAYKVHNKDLANEAFIKRITKSEKVKIIDISTTEKKVIDSFLEEISSKFMELDIITCYRLASEEKIYLSFPKEYLNLLPKFYDVSEAWRNLVITYLEQLKIAKIENSEPMEDDSIIRNLYNVTIEDNKILKKEVASWKRKHLSMVKEELRKTPDEAFKLILLNLYINNIYINVATKQYEDFRFGFGLFDYYISIAKDDSRSFYKLIYMLSLEGLVSKKNYNTLRSLLNDGLEK